MSTNLTQKDLHAVLNYDQTTGIFTWKKKTSNRIKVGATAGHKMKIGYISIGIFGKPYYAHRLAWFYIYGVWPSKLIDHINRKKNENWIENLRDVGMPQNQQNRERVKGYTKHRNKWVAQIRGGGKHRYIGIFDTKEQAREAYFEAKSRLHSPVIHIPHA